MILAKLTVTDLDQFVKVFTTEGSAHRATFGSKAATAYRDTQNPDVVWVQFEWDADGVKRFLDDDRTKELMSRAGLAGPPETYILEHLTDAPS